MTSLLQKITWKLISKQTLTMVNQENKDSSIDFSPMIRQSENTQIKTVAEILIKMRKWCTFNRKIIDKKIQPFFYLKIKKQKGTKGNNVKRGEKKTRNIIGESEQIWSSKIVPRWIYPASSRDIWASTDGPLEHRFPSKQRYFGPRSKPRRWNDGWIEGGEREREVGDREEGNRGTREERNKNTSKGHWARTLLCVRVFFWYKDSQFTRGFLYHRITDFNLQSWDWPYPGNL